MTRLHERSAFSLVELSIVLVILGLLTGGILGGQALIRAAELRSVATEFNKFSTATMTFRDKYFALPGDMVNASSFWGLAAAGNACISTVGTGTQTCNGNGNGYADGTSSSAEDLRFWQHLANAALIEGNYTGVEVATTYYSIGGNSPKSKLSNAFWGSYGRGTAFAGNTQYFPQKPGNFFGVWTFAGTHLTPAEAWNIDTKVDDGKPATGKAMSDKGTLANPCSSLANQTTTAAQDAAATYNLSYTSGACGLDFDM